MKKNQNKFYLFIAGVVLCFFVGAQEKQAEGSNPQEIADKLSNPVASLISVPLQSNLDYGIGTYNGSKYTLNIQPVIPIKLSPNLNLITRYILPVIDQHDISGEGTAEFGLSDALVSGFFSPVHSKTGLIWGAGPAFLIPTGTEDFLSSRKWGVGPTVLMLRQAKGLTYGFLTNQIWSFAGDESRDDVNQMFLQPFFTKNWKTGAGLGLNAEITFNWETGSTIAFVNPIVTGVTKLGKQAISLGVGPRIPFGPTESKPNFGLRGLLTFVFPQ
jgi:hypothetical protein